MLQFLLIRRLDETIKTISFFSLVRSFFLSVEAAAVATIAMSMMMLRRHWMVSIILLIAIGFSLSLAKRFQLNLFPVFFAYFGYLCCAKQIKWLHALLCSPSASHSLPFLFISCIKFSTYAFYFFSLVLLYSLSGGRLLLLLSVILFKAFFSKIP